MEVQADKVSNSVLILQKMLLDNGKNDSLNIDLATLSVVETNL